MRAEWLDCDSKRDECDRKQIQGDRKPAVLPICDARESSGLVPSVLAKVRILVGQRRRSARITPADCHSLPCIDAVTGRDRDSAGVMRTGSRPIR